MASANKTRTLKFGSVTVVLKDVGGGNFEASCERNDEREDHTYCKHWTKEYSQKKSKKVRKLKNGIGGNSETHSLDKEDSGHKEEINVNAEHEQSKDSSSGTNVQSLEKCNVGSCTRRFSDKSKLLEHIRICHKGFVRCGCQGCRHKKPNTARISWYQLKCAQCHATFPTKLNNFNKFLMVFLSDGIGLICTGCNQKTDATLEKMKEQKRLASDTQLGPKPMLRCRLEGCETCMFSCIASLSNHLNVKHPELGQEDASPLEADTRITKNSSPRKTLSTKREIPRPFKCNFKGCVVSRSIKGNLTIHMKCHESGSIKKCKCLGCDENKAKSKKKTKLKKILVKRPHEFLCSSCKTMLIVTIHVEHQLIKGGFKFKCHQCDSVVESGQLTPCSDTSLSPTKGFTMICSHCDKTFLTMSPFNKHMKIHSTETVTCKLCNATVRNSKSLERHWAKCKSLENPCACESCGKTYFNQYALSDHRSKVHNSSKSSYMCDKCGKSYTSGSNLKRHREMHEDDYEPKKQKQVEEPAICDICGKCFASMVRMKQHKHRTHQPKTILCVCGKSFKTNLLYTRHYDRMHSKKLDFPCPECGQEFFRKFELERHKKLKHQGLELICRFCDKKLRTFYGLKIHEERHSKEPETHHCELCNKTFISKLGYSTHMKKHLQ